MGCCNGKRLLQAYPVKKYQESTTKTYLPAPSADNACCKPARYRPENRPDFTEGEKQVILESWKIIHQDIARVGVIMLLGLFETHPDVQEVFPPFRGLKLDELRESILLKTHVLKVMGIVEKCMARIDKPEKMETMLHELGNRHAVYKAKPEHLDMIIPQFVKAVIPSMGDRWTPEVESAWDHFFQYILHIVKEGMVL